MVEHNYQLARFPPNALIDPWVSEMERLDLPSRRSVLKRFKPTPMAPFLYKYLSVDREHSHTNLRDVIVNSVLRLSPASDFNDPFEMQAHVYMSGTEEERRQRFEGIARREAPHLGWRAVRARVDALMLGREETFAGIWQASLKGIRDTVGVYSFAGRAKNLLMWSHYASDHKGVCLQFERVLDIATLAHAIRARYAPNLPEINWVTGFYQGVGEMLFAKHPCWEYEQESRIIIDGQARRYLQFAPQALRKLIFGCRVEESLLAAANGWLAERLELGYPPIDVYFASQHPRKYRLVFLPDPATKKRRI